MSLRDRTEWKFFAALPKADPLLAAVWWGILVLRGVLPPALGLAMGLLVGAVTRGASLTGPLVLTGIIFVLLQVLPPIQQAVSANLDANAAITAGPPNFTSKTSIVTYDNIGNKVTLDVYMFKTAANTWDMQVYNNATSTAGGYPC